MKKVTLVLCSVLMLFSCDSNMSDGDESYEVDALSSTSKDSGGSSGSGNEGNGENPGQITAGEWNDLEHWDFWSDLLNSQDYTEHQENWSFNTSKRIAFQIFDQNTSEPLNNVTLSLFKENVVISEAKTDNLGEANLFVNLFNSENASSTVNLADYDVAINGELIDETVMPFNDGVNVFNIQNTITTQDKIEVSFIVDATGSMSDELEFLKSDLTNVISRVQEDNQNSTILTSTVFYRDEGDEYVTRRSDFTSSIASTVNFINKQSAGGGGDFPEAVEAALAETLDDLQWSTNSKTRIAFLLLDAPPHQTEEVNQSVKKSLITASKNGVKLIPVTASGIDKSTEFLMRYFAIATNGTYVFITNDSGIGNEHLEPTVGAYDVEFLNNLLVRLINKYAE
ncbi:vWA domain-containing protein [Algibacter sp. Ld11]|uniref:vWA domain-containing protein n=1 Tax=Algibacter sp. Ld11 TaxID=649150 RepID=UPI00386D692F